MTLIPQNLTTLRTFVIPLAINYSSVIDGKSVLPLDNEIL